MTEEAMDRKTHKCQYTPKCVDEVEVIYYGLGLCDKHWTKIANMTKAEAHAKLGIKE